MDKQSINNTFHQPQHPTTINPNKINASRNILPSYNPDIAGQTRHFPDKRDILRTNNTKSGQIVHNVTTYQSDLINSSVIVKNSP
jgi:hypothetical protein